MKKKTLAEFVAQFNQIHEGKGYQVLGEYVGTHTKIAIECPTHGIWEALPGNLLKGQGCPQCGIKQRADKFRKTHSEFLTNFSQVHEGKGYRVVGEYINNHTKIAIECPTHGIWEAAPSNLLSGQGCPQCYGNQKKTHAEFVAQFNQVHKGKGYRVVGEYISVHTKIAIQCPTHGIWEATPGSLLKGSGCLLCSGNQKKTHAEFIVKFNQVHEGKGYQILSEYINNHTKIAIECPTHGIWEATPDGLLAGRGCHQCGIKQSADKKRKSHHEFVTQFNQVHKGKGYQVVSEYIGNKTKVAIQCPTHGIWKAIPADLLNGGGCPCCAKTGFNPSKEAIFYLFEIDKNRNTYYGFGISNQYDIRKKEHLKNLTKGNAILKNEWAYQFAIGYECRELESHLKYLLKEKGLNFNLEIEGFLDECAVGSALPLILRCIDESKYERQAA